LQHGFLRARYQREPRGQVPQRRSSTYIFEIARCEQFFEDFDAGILDRPEIPAVECGLMIALGEMSTGIAELIESKTDEGIIVEDFPDRVDPV
jgi:hypothetical protein